MTARRGWLGFPDGFFDSAPVYAADESERLRHDESARRATGGDVGFVWVAVAAVEAAARAEFAPEPGRTVRLFCSDRRVEPLDPPREEWERGDFNLEFRESRPDLNIAGHAATVTGRAMAAEVLLRFNAHEGLVAALARCIPYVDAYARQHPGSGEDIAAAADAARGAVARARVAS